jgi:hypothetical protein
MKGGRRHVSVRLDDPTIARLDALIPAFSQPWLRAKRSDVLRAALLAGLPVIEVEKAGERGRKRGAR